MKKHKAASFIICLLLVCLLVVGGTVGSILWGLYGDSVGIVDPEDVDPTAKDVQIAREDQKDQDVVNILLVGSDARDPDAELGRSDTMMLVSFNKAEGKATVISFLRDTLIDIDGYGMSKLGHTFAYGGVGLTINTLNKQFDLDIQDYVSVNFLALADVVDLLGGLEIENHLNGVQAVSYARIRYTAGGDFTRTERQRLVISKIVEKVQDAGIVKMNEIIDAVLPEVSTSLSGTEILKMAAGVFDYTLGETKGFPFDTATPESVPGYTGSYVVPVGLEKNVRELHQFLFPDQQYTPTEDLVFISDNIAYITGIYPEVTEESTEETDGY